jgi:transposase
MNSLLQRTQVGALCEQVQEVTGGSVKLVWLDQGYTGGEVAKVAKTYGINLEIVKLPEAKKGFVLLPRRWVVERSFGWISRFRRLARDYKRLVETVSGLTYLAFVMLMLAKARELGVLTTS